MQLSDFDYHLPSHLIAKYPLAERTASRLLCLEKKINHGSELQISETPRGILRTLPRDDRKVDLADDKTTIVHRQFTDILQLINSNDVLIFNNSRVIKARLFGKKESGGQVEILVERVLDDKRVLAHIRASKSLKIGKKVLLANEILAEVIARRNDLFELQFDSQLTCYEILENIGHTPLPPYIDREDKPQDLARYQTVYAEPAGSVAAPTAGLHFDENLLKQLKEKGVAMGFVTLHVGAGTFQPVRVNDITQHQMHHEYIEVPTSVCEKIAVAKKKGGRVIAVGTTTVRSLETAAKNGELAPYYGETNIFIYPGFNFQCVDVMITNFHLPKSSLLMLVSAFAGFDNIMQAYQEAITHKYRFYSYGDAMWLEK